LLYRPYDPAAPCWGVPINAQEKVQVATGEVEMNFRKTAATLAVGLLVGIACLATPSRADD
jgi:hypothetical protein